MVTTLPLIKLTERSPLVRGAIILKAPPSRLQRILEFQPKITPFLVGTLAAPAGVGAAVGAFLTTGFVAGALETKTGRRFIGGALKDPGRVGRTTFEVIEDPSRLFPKDVTTKGVIERVKEFVGKGAIPAAVGAAAVGGIAVAAKKVKGLRLPSRKIAPQVLPVGLLPAAPSITSTTQPLGAVQQPIEELPVAVKEPKPMKITNTFNPTIDIRFSKSKRFINQQIIVK